MPFLYPKSDIFYQICRDTALPSPLRPDTALPFPYPESDIFYQICLDTALPSPLRPDTALPFPYYPTSAAKATQHFDTYCVKKPGLLA